VRVRQTYGRHSIQVLREDDRCPSCSFTEPFHLVNRTSAGNETGLEPDGDSIQFKPRNATLLDRLDQLGRPLSANQDRLHPIAFRGHRCARVTLSARPRPRVAPATPVGRRFSHYLTRRYRLNPVPYVPPRGIRVDPPVQRDPTAGYIFFHSVEANGPRVAFAFVGQAPSADGTKVRLDVPLLRQSLNFRSLQNGHAYPLFYDTLFADPRAAHTRHLGRARSLPRLRTRRARTR
jgi:hypothetical protein